MVTDELIGLPAELRKALKSSLQVSNEEFFFCREHTAEEGDEYREKVKWLPAVLAAKDRSSIKEEIRKLSKVIYLCRDCRRMQNKGQPAEHTKEHLQERYEVTELREIEGAFGK